ncbi:MAG: peptidoglycan binding domain-containing protein [Eubacteriales bacterium]|nr:peptidoglycan binding domain-containing protein [Eubacteriales bacterium]
MTEKKAKMGTGKKVVITLILLLLFLTAGAYTYGVYYFSGHFLPGSMVNGFNCSYMTAWEAEELIAKKVGAYALTIGTMNNGQEAIRAGEAGLSFQSSGGAAQLIKDQDRLKWFLAFSQERSYDVAEDLAIDQALLDQAIGGLSCMQAKNVTQPADAQIQDTGDTFQIVPEVEGNALDPQKLKEVVTQAMLTGRTYIDLVQEACYQKPRVYRDDGQLIQNCQRMNELCRIIITYDFADRKETVDRSLIKDWFTADENGDVILDREKISQYVAGLKETYDTFGADRSFLTYDNREVAVQGGDYGWIIDQERETKELAAAIESGETQVRQPVYEVYGYSRDTNDIGYTYVEIDLTNQRLVFYEGGKPVVDTPVVTGNPNIPGCETPTGCFSVDDKKSPSVLTGEDYEAEVAFWIPFSGNVGLHDATWRTEFGGNLYMLEGSHGCVNLPYDQAAALYGRVEPGMPVVVYK